MPAVAWWISNLQWVDVLAAFKCKAAFFISGLIMSYCVVEYAVGGILVSYLTDKWEENDTVKAYVIMSAKEGITSVLKIVVAHITDAYLGRFTMISVCTICYVIGLCLLWFVDPADKIALFMVVVGLISFGEAGQENPLKAFLADQLRKNCPNELKVEVRTRFWWRSMRLIGALIGILAHERHSWNAFFICFVMMSLALLLFVYGFPNYYYQKTTGSPLITIFRVLVAAISNRHLRRSNDPTDYCGHNIDDQLPLIPDILYFRWLDKAALIVTTLPSIAQEQVKNRKQCSVTQVKEVKSIIAMVPMWATFLVYCLMNATGSSFFFDQRTNLEDRIFNYKVPIVSLYVFHQVSSYGIKALCELIITHKWSRAQKFTSVKVRIGLGMLCSFLCCVAARLVELQRLDKITKDGYRNSDTDRINMSIFWLTPQFCLLGLMEGLAERGLEEFFNYQVADSLERYEEPFNQFALGIGKFISIFWVLTFKHWFGANINRSRLDNYYGILAVMSLGNLAVVYPFVSTNYYKHLKEEEDLNMNEALQDLIEVKNQLQL